MREVRRASKLSLWFTGVWMEEEDLKREERPATILGPFSLL
jgi:hypothetical protein